MYDELLLLSEEDVRALLSPEDVIGVVEQVFQKCAQGDTIYGPIGKMPVDAEGRNFYMTFPTGLRSMDLVGMKWFCGYGAPLPGYPFSHGNLLLLVRLSTGSPFALMGAGAITAMRTAGGHGVVAAKHLANPDPETLAVIGSGAQARAGVRGFLAAFPSLRRICLWSRTPERAAALCREFSRWGPELICAPSAREAVAQADLVLTATTSPEILVKADWIRSGATVIAITAFTDLDPAITERADKWVLGNLREDVHNILETPSLCHGYPLCRERVHGDLSQVITGQRPGRERADEIIVYSHMGMGFFDIACGKAAYDRAVEQKRGQHFRLGAIG